MNTRNSNKVIFDSLESRQHFAAGALDTTFDGDGKASLTRAGLTAVDVAVQPDGKSVVVGNLKTGNDFDFAVARFNLDGTPDATFGSNGFVQTPVGEAREAFASIVAIAPDGKIVVGGRALIDDGFEEDELIVVRYNTNGSRDTTFDGDGIRRLDVGSADLGTSASDLAVQPDGKIVVVGTQIDLFSSNEFYAVRFNLNGTLDSSFDGDGKRFIAGEFAKAVRLTNTGQIVIAGSDDSRQVVVKLNPNGSVVSSFSGDGVASFTLAGTRSSFTTGLLLQGDKVIVTGTAIRTGQNQSDIFVARLTSAGTLDPTFGGNGTGFRITDLGGSDTVREIESAPSGNGFIVSGGSGGFAVVKYTQDGIPDSTFASGGIKKFGSSFPGVASIARGPGKRFMLTGGANFLTARVLDAGANVVNAGSFQPNAFEQGVRPSGFIVTRSERLPVPTRVFFTVGGNATVGRLFLPSQGNPNDYTVMNMTIPFQGPIIGGGSSTPFVDIPANQTFVGVTLTPIDDTRTEGTETATFNIIPNASYDLGSNKGTTISIFDNDTTGVTLNATADAFVKGGTDANSNFGTGGELLAKNSADASFTRQIYLKFNLTGTTTINNAKLRLFGGLSTTAQPSIALSVFGADDTSWSESGINFNNKPVTNTSALSTTTIAGTTSQFYDWDITSYLKQQKALGKTAVTLVLRATANSDPFAKFNSREAGAGPQIVVT